MNTRVQLLIVVAGLLGWTAFESGRRNGRRSRASRRTTLRLAIVGLVVSLVIAFGVPQWITMNNDSPAGVIVYFGAWLIGGFVGTVCLLTIAGALSVRPPEEVP